MPEDPSSSLVLFEVRESVAVIALNRPPVNAFSHDLRVALLERIDDLRARGDVHAAVLIGSGAHFAAGTDINEFDLPIVAPQLPEIACLIEELPIPFVAAIDGAALGGGLELALACDARIATPRAQLGLTEVALGMVPGAGGTQRLPRLIGRAEATELICSGARISGRRAFELHLVDELVDVTDLLTRAVRDAHDRIGTKRRTAQLPIDDLSARSFQELQAAWYTRTTRANVRRAFELVQLGSALPVEEALATERATFLELRDSTTARARRHIFFAERRTTSVSGLAHATPREIASVGIVGAGAMGAGIGAIFALAGRHVILVDQGLSAAKSALARTAAVIDRTRDLRVGDAERAKALLSCRASIDELGGVDFVVEAVFEDKDLKAEVFRELGDATRPGTILASNTSYIDIATLAGASGRPRDVVGMHFFNPPQRMPLVEVIRTAQSSPEAIATAMTLVRMLGKQPVVARSAEGFIGNRIYSVYRAQCEFLIEEGAFPEDVDRVIESVGFAMGPFSVFDLTGLETAWRMRQRRAAEGAVAHRYVTIPDQLCEMGRLGKIAGAGWYDYDAAGRKTPSVTVRNLIVAASRQKGLKRRAIPDDEIARRLLLSLLNEAAIVLDDGIADKPGDIDVVIVRGYGFPEDLGGPLWWGAEQDRDELVQQLRELAERSYPGYSLGDVSGQLDRLNDEPNGPRPRRATA